MKAYVLEGIGDLQYKDVEMPACSDGWALLKVKASSICSSDIPRIFTKGTYHFPTIPGHEYSGIVVDVHDEADRHWIGKKVAVFPLIPCKKCEQCLKGKYEMCADYDYTGSRRDGGFAEYVAVPVWNLIELPEGIDCDEAALLEPLAVAYHSAIRAGICAGDSVGVVGTGMIGISVGKWALSMGAASVTILGRGESKRQLVEHAGGLNYAILSQCSEKFDKVVEAVGTPESICAAIDHVKADGRLVLMGNPSGDICLPQAVYWQILRKQLTVVGTWNSSYECGMPSDWTKAIDAIKDNSLQVSDLISHRFKKEELMSGLEIMRDHLEPYCRIVIYWD